MNAVEKAVQALEAEAERQHLLDSSRIAYKRAAEIVRGFATGVKATSDPTLWEGEQ